ncbi:unnamed protein product [Symbiodinium microadriaticum]|nr:unnamed protein product [Symbiodinium microadriaticum]
MMETPTPDKARAETPKKIEKNTLTSPDSGSGHLHWSAMMATPEKASLPKKEQVMTPPRRSGPYGPMTPPEKPVQRAHGPMTPLEKFEGGTNCFASAETEDVPAMDMAGEKLRHWITPVTKGKRVILQIELSRV